MKRLFLILIISLLIISNCQQTSQAGLLSTYKARITKIKTQDSDVKQIRDLFELQDTYTNSYNYDDLYKIYSDDFINSDGYDKNLYFKLIKETWETYPEITYKTEIKNVVLASSKYATVETLETSFAVSEESNEHITAIGELHSVARCRYHLRKDYDNWVITAEDILEEYSALKFGDARFIKMELNSPSLVAAGSAYSAELKVDAPQDQIIVASISRENIKQPPEKAVEKYKTLPKEQIIERLFTANTENVNEYNIASVGVTKSEPVDEENIKVYLNGLAFLMRRVNVVPKNNFIKIEDIESGKTE